MLVITRGVGQEIVIGDHIKVVIKHLNGNRVRIGIDAPPQVPIKRGERMPPPEKK